MFTYLDDITWHFILLLWYEISLGPFSVILEHLMITTILYQRKIIPALEVPRYMKIETYQSWYI